MLSTQNKAIYCKHELLLLYFVKNVSMALAKISQIGGLPSCAGDVI